METYTIRVVRENRSIWYFTVRAANIAGTFNLFSFSKKNKRARAERWRR